MSSKYDSYGQSEPHSSRWKGGSYGSSNSLRPSLSGGNRTSLSGSIGSRAYSSKDRARGSSLSKSVNNGKRGGDTYYPRSSYSSATGSPQSFGKSQVDRYSSKYRYYDYPKGRNFTPEDHSSDYYSHSHNNSPQGQYTYSKKQYPDQQRSKSPQNQNSDEENEVDVKPEDISRNEEEEDDDENEDDDDNEGEEEEDEEEEYANNQRDSVSLTKDSFIPDEQDIEKEDERILTSELTHQLGSNQLPSHASTSHDEVITESSAPLPGEANGKITVTVDEVSYPNGCIYPLGKLETQFNALKEEFDSKSNSNDVKYALVNPIKDLHEYPFFKKNIQTYVQTKDKLISNISIAHRANQKKKLRLWTQYKDDYSTWEVARKKMEQQLKVIHPPGDESKKELENINVRLKNLDQASEVHTPTYDVPPTTGRRSRRHGDLVTTEAEFQEILKSLGKQDEEDPMIKANKVAAKIPDFIINEVERENFIFMDSNNIVEDKLKWTERVKTDPINNFSEKEQELFCEAFCRYPKRFGAISRFMGGLRTIEECVVHYYMTKKEVNYKYLVAQYKKKSTKKNGRRGKNAKSRNVSQSNAVEAPAESVAISKETETKVVGETTDTTLSEESATPAVKEKTFIPGLGEVNKEDILYSETGRRKRVTATAQDDKKKETFESQPAKKKRKRKEDEDSVKAESEPAHRESSMTPPPAVAPVFHDLMDPENRHLLQEDMDGKRKAISSYWSITEATAFPSLLMEYGTKWSLIANRLSSKTTTMVRNYYQRNAEKNGWNTIAEEADIRLAKYPPSAFPEIGSMIPKIEDGHHHPIVGMGQPIPLQQPQDPTRRKSIYDPTKEMPGMDHQAIAYGYQGPLMNPPGPPHLQAPMYAPMGTFQHAIPNRNMYLNHDPLAYRPPPQQGYTPQALQPTHLPVPNPVSAPPKVSARPTISSLLSDTTPETPAKPALVSAYSEPPRPQLPLVTSQPHKSSIMSLLNSDPSPTKTPSEPPKSKTSLNDLLNSPSSPAPLSFPPAQPNTIRSNRISSLLSEPNPNENP